MLSFTSLQIDGENLATKIDSILLGSKITTDCGCITKLKETAPWKKSCDKPRQSIKKQRHYFADKGPYSQSCGFPSSHMQM